MKNKFYGKYYKFISDNNYVFSVIISHANEGDMIQIINPDGAYFTRDTKSVVVDNDTITFNVNENDISITGSIKLGKLNPLKSKVMGPFTYLPMECRHEIYSMRHELNGELIINNKKYTYNNSLGYIEGDMGKSFPKKYIWYNSVKDDVTVTLAIATIPLFGFIKFKGLLAFIKTKDKEYKICTYNFGKIKLISDKKIVIKKGKYKFELEFASYDGHNLKAPKKGNMDRFIKEAITTKTKYKLYYKNDIIIEEDDDISSLEYVW